MIEVKPFFANKTGQRAMSCTINITCIPMHTNWMYEWMQSFYCTFHLFLIICQWVVAKCRYHVNWHICKNNTSEIGWSLRLQGFDVCGFCAFDGFAVLAAFPFSTGMIERHPYLRAILCNSDWLDYVQRKLIITILSRICIYMMYGAINRFFGWIDQISLFFNRKSII